jgi:hypothetical protein
VVACVRLASGSEVSRAVRTFETTTARQARRPVKRLAELGFSVDLKSPVAA